MRNRSSWLVARVRDSEANYEHEPGTRATSTIYTQVAATAFFRY